MERLTPLTPSERADRLLADERAESRDRRHAYLAALGGAVGSVALGLFLIGNAVHTTDVRTGEVFFWAGLLVGNGGWFASMSWAWYRAYERGGF
ncbi:MAG TPA: hypothetical protein VJ802_07540 [Gemmatimonadaceae bacterium]|nr:hypothetical protein [Gemmatimonadaceae bacterium]